MIKGSTLKQSAVAAGLLGASMCNFPCITSY